MPAFSLIITGSCTDSRDNSQGKLYRKLLTLYWRLHMGHLQIYSLLVCTVHNVHADTPEFSVWTGSAYKGSGIPTRIEDSWEIVEGLRGVPASMQEPDRQEGILLKRRKWPMKGWHKRYFVLEKGILKYGKRGTDLKKGKLHGCIDVGLSVMSIKKKAMCIDLDTEDNIYHLKVKSPELFEEWVSKLRHHRVFRQNEIAMYPHERHLFHPHASSSPSLNDTLRKRATLTKQGVGPPG
ncbi:Oxysterol-binding protein-related protein 3 [Larimichthys crocea]|uniref:Uncharacterized protein n=1 Tax=Larimichthys crocea TaxID=215358 RepID=A0ACD3RGL7_LARCR|nr:Oxysterol-binding protein-related protein 3 [Larimichthys crocea]